MPDWSAIPVAVISGGLAGAVAGPAATFAFDRLRAKQARREARERRLRRMLEEALDRGRRVLAAAHMVRQSTAGGLPYPDPLDVWRLVGLPSDSPPAWQPERIDDPDLQQAARRHAEVIGQLVLGISYRSLGDEQLERLAAELQGLQAVIAVRMDNLQLAEAED